MDFGTKYATLEEKNAYDLLPVEFDKDLNPIPKEPFTKTIISNDAFAVGGIIDELIKKIEHTRLSLMK